MFKYFILIFIFTSKAFAQLSPEQTIQFKLYSDSLNIWSDTLINSSIVENKQIASYRIIKTLKNALLTKGSYNYPFDSLTSIAVIQPEDKSFRVFTWQLQQDENNYRYFGVIQMAGKTNKLYPLVDYGQFYQNPDSIIVDANRWIGALYYNITKVKSGKKNYYTLFGWDGNNSMSSKKYIDVLWFDKEGAPKFGYPLFLPEKGKSPTRVILEYKKEASLSLNYYAEDKMIMFDHTAPLSGIEEGFYFNYVPDGTLDGYKWENGLWRYISNIAYEKLEDGQAPNVQHKPTPVLYQPK